jgi:hypothetical protein
MDQKVKDRIVGKFKRDISGFERGKYQNISIKSIRDCLKQLGLTQFNT